MKKRRVDLKFFDDMRLFDQGKEEQDTNSKGLSVEKVKTAMELLPNGARMIFSLYLLEGYDHVEIAQILNISESNSKSQYMRAKRKVKEILTEQKV